MHKDKKYQTPVYGKEETAVHNKKSVPTGGTLFFSSATTIYFLNRAN
jgi:hypothetical protein